MSDNPFSSKVVFDVTDFKAGVTELNRNIRVIESGFRAAAAGMGDWEKSSAGLEARITALNSKMELQRQKVDGLQSVYTKLASSGKASKKELDELQIRINKETETLNKMEGELKQSTTALDQMGKETDGAGKEMKELAVQEEKAGTAGEKMGGIMRGLGGALKVGVTAVIGLAAAAAAAGVALAAVVMKSADMAGELVDTANKTGLSVEKLQELAFVGNQIGVSTETITGAMAKMVRSMTAAKKGTGEQADAFRKLKVSVKNADGTLRDSETVFQEAVTALGGISNETDRDALAMALFGKSAQELNPLIKTSADEMAELTKKAHTMGAVMSEDNVNALESFGDTVAGLQDGLKGVAGTLAAIALPGFSKMAERAQTYLGMLATIVSSSNGDLGVMAERIGWLVMNMPELSAVTDVLREVMGALAPGIQAISQAFAASLPMIRAFIEQGWQFLMTTISTIAPQIIANVNTMLQQIAIFWTAHGAQIMAVVSLIWNVLVATIGGALAIISGLITTVLAVINGDWSLAWQTIQDTMTTFFTLALSAVGTNMQEFNTVWKNNLEMARTIITTAFDKIITWLGGMIVKFRDIGVQLMLGLRDGIIAKVAEVISSVVSFASNIIDVIKKHFGIQSPSKVFAGIGENMALGLGMGFSNSFKDISKTMLDSMGNLANANFGNMNLAGAGAGNANGGLAAAPIHVYVTANVAGPTDEYAMAYRIADVIQQRQNGG